MTYDNHTLSHTSTVDHKDRARVATMKSECIATAPLGYQHQLYDESITFYESVNFIFF